MRHQRWFCVRQCKLYWGAKANVMLGCVAEHWSSSSCRLYSTVRRCSSHLLDWMETQVISWYLRPKSVYYRNVSSKADRHYSLLPAHWGCSYCMYNLQHMVHPPDGGNSTAVIEKRKLNWIDLIDFLKKKLFFLLCVVKL